MQFRILYVEDEDVLGALVTEFLAKAGYEVTRVANGIDAWSAFRETKPHLCLFDIMLPGKSGYEVARQIRNADREVPIIFITAKVQASDVVSGFEAGCNDYIRKPFNIEELKVRIMTWLTERYGKTEEVREKVICLDGLTFYYDKQVLANDDTNIRLSYKESMVLLLLYQHRSNIIAREFLLKKVWGDNTVYNSRSLDVYITRLRKYFANTRNNIITLRSIGYRFLLPEDRE